MGKQTHTTKATKGTPDAVKAAPTPAIEAAPVATEIKAAPAPATPAPATDEPKTPRSVVPGRYKKRYAATRNTCGDPLAIAFKDYTFDVDGDGRDSVDMAKVHEVAKANGIDTTAYASLNNGMVRMNVANRLRGMLKHGKTVTIGSQTLQPKVAVAAA
jgi:hypothetical protein